MPIFQHPFHTKKKKAAAKPHYPVKKSPPLGEDKTGLFADLNFKLVVIDALLQQENSFSTSLAEMENRYVDSYAYYSYTPIPEMIRFFEELPLTQDDLNKVTCLVFDGGRHIYDYLMPDWDGESDEFDVESVDGFSHLPNLSRVEYVSLCDPALLDAFLNAGITVK